MPYRFSLPRLVRTVEVLPVIRSITFWCFFPGPGRSVPAKDLGVCLGQGGWGVVGGWSALHLPLLDPLRPAAQDVCLLTSGRLPCWVCSPLCARVWKLPLRSTGGIPGLPLLVSTSLGIPGVCCLLSHHLEKVAIYICTVFCRFMVEE